MSYILEALRRAEAERQRGAVPGLHTPPPTSSPSATPPDTRWRQAGLVLALAGAGLAGAAGWWFWPAAPAPRLPAATGSADGAAPAREPKPPPAPPAIVVPPLPPAAPPPEAPAPDGNARAAKLSPSPATTKGTTSAPLPESPIQRYEQLPESTRQQLPNLALGGVIYSDNAASRMLIIGGQLLHEGDSPVAGVVIEQIRPRSAVLRWRDLRYEVRY